MQSEQDPLVEAAAQDVGEAIGVGRRILQLQEPLFAPALQVRRDGRHHATVRGAVEACCHLVVTVPLADDRAIGHQGCRLQIEAEDGRTQAVQARLRCAANHCLIQPGDELGRDLLHDRGKQAGLAAEEPGDAGLGSAGQADDGIQADLGVTLAAEQPGGAAQDAAPPALRCRNPLIDPGFHAGSGSCGVRASERFITDGIRGHPRVY